MAITRGEFLRSLGRSLPGLVASTGVATAAEALIRRVAQAAPEPVAPSAPLTPFFEQGRTDQNQIALTFDDGPVPGVTELILDELKRREVRATFFMIGRQVTAAPELARRVLNEGHEIGNHTFTHRKLTELSDGEISEEVSKTQMAVEEATGHRAAWFRPPFGAFRQNQAALLKPHPLGVALWSVDAEDWRRPEAARIAGNIAAGTRAGSIVLCHELPETAACLAQILDGLQERKFRLETVSALLPPP